MQLREIRRLVNDAQRGDRLVFYCELYLPSFALFSSLLIIGEDGGHGCQLYCKPGSSEADGLDEGQFRRYSVKS